MNKYIDEQKAKIGVAVDQLFKELQAGRSENLKRYLEFISSFHNYSFGNTILIWLQRPDSTRVTGLRKWNEKDFWVKKGEKAMQILAPQMSKFYYDKDGNKIYFFKLSKMERKRIEADPEITVYKSVSFRVVNVFDISQCENKTGNPIPEFFHNIGNGHKGKYQMIKAIMEKEGIKIEMVNGTRYEGSSHGGLVAIKEERDFDNKLLTLIHEFAHEILHKNTDLDNFFNEDLTRNKEVEAEAVSYIVSNFLEIHNPFSADYILHWGKDKKMLEASLKVVLKASNQIIDLIKASQNEQKVA